MSYFRPILAVVVALLLLVEGVVALWAAAKRNDWKLPTLEYPAYAQEGQCVFRGTG